MFQNLPTPPSLHVIIEPHKDVLAHMRRTGWYDRPDVKILEGRWQDFICGHEIYENGGWDVIYVDTFAEGYEGMLSCNTVLMF
jgi:type IV protein arginine methyltransferase